LKTPHDAIPSLDARIDDALREGGPPASVPPRLRARVLSQVRFEAGLAQDTRRLVWLTGAWCGSALLFAVLALLWLQSNRWSIPGAWGRAQSLWPAMPSTPSLALGAALFLAAATTVWLLHKRLRPETA
jgi:hypothetical protein